MTSAVVLTWVAPTVGTTPFTYQAQYSLNQSNWINVGQPISATTVIVQGLSDGTTYYFRVAAINAAGTGPWSTTATITTLTTLVAPGAPASITPSGATSSSILVSWTAPTVGTSPFTYQLQYATTSGGPWSNFGSAVSSLNETVTGLNASTTYYFRVAAINTAGQGPYSATASLATQAAAGVAPGAPGSLATSNATQASINLTWSAPTTGTTPFTYQPQYGTSSTGPWASFGPAISTTNVTVTGLTASTLYYFRVNAINNAGQGPYSNIASLTTGAAGASGSPPYIISSSPFAVAVPGGQTVTLTGTGFTGATMSGTGGVQVPVNVISDTQLTYTAISSGPSVYYPQEFFLTTAYGQSARFSLVYENNVNGTMVPNDVNGVQVSGNVISLTGWVYPATDAIAAQLFIVNGDGSHTAVGSPITATPGQSAWTLSWTVTSQVGAYFFHYTSSSGGDAYGNTFNVATSLTGPNIQGSYGNSYVPGQTNVPPLPIFGQNFGNVTQVLFGTVPSPSFTYTVHDPMVGTNRIDAVVPAQTPGTTVNITMVNSTGQVSNPFPFSYMHNIVAAIPPSVGGAAPVEPASWKGPFTAVNAPKAGQVTSVTVDPVHGNTTGTGSFGGNNNLWADFSFLHQIVGTGYPALADGGTVHIVAGTIDAGPFARTWVADFPGGINIIGAGADQTTIINNNAPSGQGLLVFHSNAYVYGCNFEMDGVDENTGGYSAIKFYNDPVGPNGDGSSSVNTAIHCEKCRFNQCEMCFVSGEGYTYVGENLTLFLKDVDFSLLIPDCYNTDILSHEVYSGAQQYWINCNAYGPKYGAIHKGRSASITLVNCWSRRTLNRWVDYPDGGVFRAYNCLFTENLQADSDDTGDTDLHCFEYCSAMVGYGVVLTVTSPTFYNCDIYFSRLRNLSNGALSGEDFMSYPGIPITFSNCRAHWSNANNGDQPKVIIVDALNFAPIPNGIVGIPTSNPGSTWEALPALPTPRTP